MLQTAEATIMRRYKRNIFPRLLPATAGVLIIVGCIWLFALRNAQNKTYGFDREVPEAEQNLRMLLVTTAEQWLGAKEEDGSHQRIIDLYNGHEPLAQGYTVQYDDQWCATFVSASAIEAGLTEIIPTECGCQRQIGLFQERNSWEEDDGYIPLPGDIIYYSRSNTDAINDCTGWSDHVGIIVGTNGRRIKVIEGNYGNAVAYRYINVDALMIRGYAIPDYASLCPAPYTHKKVPG